MVDYRKLVPDGISIRDMMAKAVPKIYAERASDLTDYLDGVDIIVCLRLTDVGDVWTVRFNADEIEVENGELIDFPILTVEGTASQWEAMRADVVTLLETINSRQPTLKTKRKFDARFRAALEKLDGTIDLTIVTDAGELSFRLILNNYEAEAKFRNFKVAVSRDTIFDLVEGRITLESAASALKIKGDVGLAMDLGRLVVKHFEL